MNACASCRHPISDTAEWCCEPCANSSGHASTCRLLAESTATSRTKERHDDDEEAGS